MYYTTADGDVPEEAWMADTTEEDLRNLRMGTELTPLQQSLLAAERLFYSEFGEGVFGYYQLPEGHPTGGAIGYVGGRLLYSFTDRGIITDVPIRDLLPTQQAALGSSIGDLWQRMIAERNVAREASVEAQNNVLEFLQEHRK